MNKLPKRTKSQKIGQSAEDICSAILTNFCNVIPVPGGRDLGIDFICELMQGEYPTGQYFNVQCKGKANIEGQGDNIKIKVNVTTINYWLLHNYPTFIIVVDCEKYIFYWCFPEEFLDSLGDKNWQT